MPIENLAKEAARVLEESERKGVTLRLIGGLAFYFRCPSAKLPGLAREYGDIDVVGHQKQTREIRELFENLGYTPRARFNALQGQRRLIFEDLPNGRRIDVFLDVFEMCHKLELGKRLEVDRYTLSLADLLTTKLQIVEINTKDMKDALSLFADYDVGESDGSLINGRFVAKLCGSDWGLYKTLTTNLEKLVVQAKECDFTEDVLRLVDGRITRLKEMIEAFPKSTGWKMRASVGERVRWYELPEAT